MSITIVQWEYKKQGNERDKMSERQVTRWCNRCEMATSWLFSGSMRHGFCEYCDTPNKPEAKKVSDNDKKDAERS